YARHDGLSRAGAFVAGAGYMFAGKWLLHLLAAGHYIIIGLAWLPLVLLCFEKAVRCRSLSWALAAGVAFALLFLSTHAQWMVYASLLAALWVLPTAVQDADSLRAARAGVVAWAGYGLCIA